LLWTGHPDLGQRHDQCEAPCLQLWLGLIPQIGIAAHQHRLGRYRGQILEHLAASGMLCQASLSPGGEVVVVVTLGFAAGMMVFKNQ